MFGCLVAGRLVQTDIQRIDKTHFVFNIENADTINHVVVFLTGAMPFPEGMGGAIHFSWPSPEGVSWQFLGYITNDKPSAIFKVSGLKKECMVVVESITSLYHKSRAAKITRTISSNNPFMQAGQHSSTVSQIGIAVEPTSQIAQRIPVENAQTSNLSNFTQFTTKMLENLFNYASSFAITQAHMTAQPDVSWVPLNVLNQWYENFKKRMLQDPNFWKT